MFCVLLHTLVVKSGYLSYCCLPVTSKQSGHSSLTSGINKAFLLKELPLTGSFSVLFFSVLFL